MNENTRDDLKSIINSFRHNGLRQLSADATGCSPNACIVRVQNTGTFSIGRFQVVFLGEAMISPEENPDAFKSEPLFKIAEQEDTGSHAYWRWKTSNWGIALEPIPKDGIGRVCVSGVTVAAVLLDENNPDDEYCDVDFRNPQMLRLHSDSFGRAKILYRSDVKNTGFWDTTTSDKLCIIHITNNETKQIQIELQEDLKANSFYQTNTTDGVPLFLPATAKAKCFQEVLPTTTTKTYHWKLTDREITVVAPLAMQNRDRIPKGTITTATWYAHDQRWIVDMPPRAEFYGIPPEGDVNFYAGCVFLGTANFFQDTAYWQNSSRDSPKLHTPPSYFINLSVPTSSFPSGDQVPWVIQQTVPKGSRQPVPIKRLGDPDSVMLAAEKITAGSSYNKFVERGTRYSLDAGNWWLTANGTRPVWYAIENGRVVYDRYMTVTCRVESLVSRAGANQTVRVLFDAAGEYVYFNCTASRGGNLAPDIYVGDNITVIVNMETIRSGSVSSRVIDFPVDEYRGSVRIMPGYTSPGRGWVYSSSTASYYVFRKTYPEDN